MNLSKMEFFALLIALFVGLHFYNQYQLDHTGTGDESAEVPALYDGNGKKPVIVAFGDGITAGVGAPPELSYPSQLSEMLGIEVVNAGVGGERTIDALRRLPGVLKRYHPDIVLLEEGMTDVLSGRKRSKIKERIKKMVETIKGSGAKAVIIGIPDMDLIDLMIASDIGLYEEVANETGSPYIPNVIGPVLKDESLKSSESLPNGRGYKKIAEKIYQYFQESGS